MPPEGTEPDDDEHEGRRPLEPAARLERRRPPSRSRRSADEAPPLRFGTDDTGPLPALDRAAHGRGAPHLRRPGRRRRPEDWSASAGQAPVWRDDRAAAPGTPADDARPRRRSPRSPLGALDERPAPSDPFFDLEDFEEPARCRRRRRARSVAVTPIRTRSAAPAGVARRRLGAPPGRRLVDGATRGAPPAATCRWPSAWVSVLAALVPDPARLGGPYLAMVLVVAGPGRRRRRVLRRAPRAGLPARHAAGPRRRGRPAPGRPTGGARRRSRSCCPSRVVATLVWYMLSAEPRASRVPNTAVTLPRGRLRRAPRLVRRAHPGHPRPASASSSRVGRHGGLRRRRAVRRLGGAAARRWRRESAPTRPSRAWSAACWPPSSPVMVLLHFAGLAPWDDELRDASSSASSSPSPPRSATSPSRC